MTNSRQLVFPQGATVSVLTSTGIVFVGQVIRDTAQRNHEEPLDPFFAIQLTTAVTIDSTVYYTVGEIVALNINSIEAIGPVSIV
ncbi:MAG: hypothetical protein H6Q73_354 [Firmicutes bacterium]|nr:hypothetical protein [Bacillota bacterium]